MRIAELLTDIAPTNIDIEATGLCLNSKNAQPGDVFVALKGETTHGIKYIDQAISKGCVAVLVDAKNIECAVPAIYIANLPSHLPALAKRFYQPAKNIKIIAVTGTNGKTSVAYFIAQLLSKLGVKNGLIGTLGISNSSQKSRHTTPDIFTLYRVLNDYYTNNIDTAVLEVSSHAISQNRIAGLEIEQVVFTNFSQDHLDYHHTLDEYLKTKAQLFALKSVKSVILNQDDKYYKYFRDSAKNKQHSYYSINDFHRIQTTQQGFLLQLNNTVFEAPLLGEFNLHNILAARSSVKQCGFDDEAIIPLLSKLTAPKGRMQKIKNRLVWVDYAHTPDALEKAITALQQHYPAFKVRVMFGCGGNRDQDKRAKMGKIASTLTDSLILTNDNPRLENPQTIIDDILSGVGNNCTLNIIKDRRLAIETAVSTLKDDECLLIAGKGHETTQQFKNEVLHLNDIDVAQAALLHSEKQ